MFDALSPSESDAVGVTLSELLELTVLDGVPDPVGVPVDVGVGEAVPLNDTVDVTVPVPVCDAVLEALTPLDNDPVGEPDRVAL